MRVRSVAFALLPLALTGCLIDTAKYLERRAALQDADGDGFANEDECDDADAAVFPGAPERCDGVDQDCDGAIDEDATDAPTWHADRDNDGFGALADTLAACDAPAGYTDDATDCDDADDAVFPGAEDTPYDGVDQDCTAGDSDDLDGDGHAATAAGGDDCDDTDATVFPEAEETWGDGFLDNDCDGEREAVVLEFGGAPFYLERPGAEFGRRLEGVGDLDGDGRAELLVSAVYDPTGGAMGGSVWLLSGSAGGEVSSSPNVAAGGSMWFLGTGLGAGPDVDGDGVADPIVGATGYDDGRGAAFGISGAALLSGGLSLPDDALWTVVGSEENSFSATVSRSLGDTDGDGLPEVAIAAPYAPAGGYANAGVVGLFSASSLDGAGTLGDADARWTGYYADALFGQDVFPVGDQDGDGLTDIGIVGSNGVPLVVVLGGGTGGRVDDGALTRITDEGVESRAEPIGDVDGDGRLDMVVSDGDALVFVDLAATATRGLDDAYARLDAEGGVVYGATDVGDRDGDGLDETMFTILGHTGYGTTWLGAVEGSAWSFRATFSPSSVRLSALSTRPNAGFGYRVVTAGELDGDGTDWLALGGYTDDQGGADAGAVAVVPVPR